MKFLSSNIHLKSINDNGGISGYASVFNIVDGYNDAAVSFPRIIGPVKNS